MSWIRSRETGRNVGPPVPKPRNRENRHCRLREYQVWRARSLVLLLRVASTVSVSRGRVPQPCNAPLRSRILVAGHDRPDCSFRGLGDGKETGVNSELTKTFPTPGMWLFLRALCWCRF